MVWRFHTGMRPSFDRGSGKTTTVEPRIKVDARVGIALRDVTFESLEEHASYDELTGDSGDPTLSALPTADSLQDEAA